MWNTIKQFYNSKEWQTFRNNIIIERSIKHNGNIVCEYCGKVITEKGEAEIDHIRELTTSNVNDYTVSLNPDNVKIACHSCHNHKHGRFSKAPEKNVFIVYGPPCSGKKTYVKEHMVRGDIVVDMDMLFCALSMCNLYDKPEKLKYNVFSIRNTIIDNIKTRYGKFNNAWIIGGYQQKHDRERLATELGAELIHIGTSKEECLIRLEHCNDYRFYNQPEYKRYIEQWFENFQQ
ncbi:MAG: HNH endonuclease [Clostridia bacterium]|jgi:hypothetical protein|nr:HNH endonuclease [Clostridia bacterium]